MCKNNGRNFLEGIYRPLDWKYMKVCNCAKRLEQLNSWAVAQFAQKWTSVPKCANNYIHFHTLAHSDTCTHFSTLSQTLAHLHTFAHFENSLILSNVGSLADLQIPGETVIAIPRKCFHILSVTVAQVFLRKKYFAQIHNITPKMFIN